MNKTTKTFTYIIGIIMSVAMVGSLILPMLSSQVGLGESAEAAVPTPLPTPTLPPPPDISALNFDTRHLHRSGLFTFAAPAGWTHASDSSSADELRAGLSNGDLLSVIEVRITRNPGNITDADALSNYMNRAWLGQTWSGYTSWDETGRSITDDDKLRLDFNLRRGRSHLIARQESWLEAGDIYSARVITAENAPQELKYILAGVSETISRLPVYADARFDWDVYFDRLDKHSLRFPADWTVVDAADGLPATVAGDGITLVIAAADGALTDEDEAMRWVERWRSGVAAISAEAAELAGVGGYKVSYRLQTVDGATDSGIALLLNGADERLHVANLRYSDIDVDLLRADQETFPMLAVVDTFRLLPELDLQA